MRKLPTAPEAPGDGRDGQVEFETAGRSGDVEAVELVAAIGPRRLAPRQGADKEELAARAIGRDEVYGRCCTSSAGRKMWCSSG